MSFDFTTIIFQLLSQRFMCGPLINQLGLGFECDCDAGFNLVTIFDAKLNCTFDEIICLDNTGLCGRSTIEAEFFLLGASNSATSCFAIDGALPGLPELNIPPGIPAAAIVPELCLTAKTNPTNPLLLDGCEIAFGNQVCQSCNICDSGFGVTFDCTNVNINTILPNLFEIPGFKVDQCIGSGLLLNLNGESQSVTPFIPATDFTYVN